tara:strand:+ start:319 stop:447 length:129 start_codon:yes stop_codon:yes gene_type:complete
MVSLFAIAMSFPFSITTKVGLIPAKPEIPFTTRSKSISKNSW